MSKLFSAMLKDYLKEQKIPELMTRDEARIMSLECTLSGLREMFDEVLYDDDARAAYRKIDEDSKKENN